MDRYVDQWIVGIEDLTDLAQRVRDCRDPALLPAERPFPVPVDVAVALGMAVVK